MDAINLESFDAQGSGKSLENWYREIVKISPIWDFSGYI